MRTSSPLSFYKKEKIKITKEERKSKLQEEENLKP